MKIHQIAQRRTDKGSYYIAQAKVLEGPIPFEAKHNPAIRKIYEKTVGRMREFLAPTPEELKRELDMNNIRMQDAQFYWVGGHGRQRRAVPVGLFMEALRNNREDPFERG